MKKNVIITGAAKRIGAGLALRFAKKGWNIFIHYNTSEKEAISLKESIIKYETDIHLFKANLSHENEIITMFEAANAAFGKLDLLINNAGIFPPITETSAIDVIYWDNIFNINLRSQFLTSREFAKFNNTNAKIINFASLGGIQIWNKRIPYNVSKAGAIQLTKALARNFAPNISVNCICPGIVKIDDDEKFPIPEEKIPMQRYANIDDIFETTYFLANCSNYITGQTLLVDGGMSLK